MMFELQIIASTLLAVFGLLAGPSLMSYEDNCYLLPPPFLLLPLLSPRRRRSASCSFLSPLHFLTNGRLVKGSNSGDLIQAPFYALPTRPLLCQHFFPLLLLQSLDSAPSSIFTKSLPMKVFTFALAAAIAMVAAVPARVSPSRSEEAINAAARGIAPIPEHIKDVIVSEPLSPSRRSTFSSVWQRVLFRGTMPF